MELINKIREQLGFPPFIKIDHNTQQAEAGAGNHQKLGQAAICAVLVGIYKYSRSEEGFYLKSFPQSSVSAESAGALKGEVKWTTVEPTH